MFPYAWLDNESKLNEAGLPQRSEFYDHIHESEISEADYMHAELLWSAMGTKTMREYLETYMLSDVLLLAVAFSTQHATVIWLGSITLLFSEWLQLRLCFVTIRDKT